MDSVEVGDSTLVALVKGLVDYAGLFPPAKLNMGEAVGEYSRQLGSADAWALGRFIVPVSKLGELEVAAMERMPQTEGESPWRLSALVGADPAGDREKIRAFNATHGRASAGLAVVEAIELKLSKAEEVGSVSAYFEGFEIYFEIESREDPSGLMAAIAGHGKRELRAKIRTGGIVQEAIPGLAEVARFLAAAARSGILIKATAGLHHPLRGEYRLTYEPDSPTGTMHGFLNLFLASAFLAEGVISQAEAEELLGERAVSAFDFSEGRVRWRGYGLDAEALERSRRDFATSYGSCSFQEPLADLRGLGLLA